MSREQGRLPQVAVVGAGYWGKNLVRDFAGLGALAAVVDFDTARRDDLAAQHGARGLSFDEALADPSIDGVVIATPAETHAKLAGIALKAGKHVYVEKPLALTMADGQRVAALAKTTGKTLMVGHLLQYHPAFIALKEAIDAGRIGRLQYVYSNRLSFGIIRREEDVLWSFAPHDLSMVLALVGEAPEKVTASGAPVLHPGISDFCQVNMTFANGVKGHVFCSWLHPFKEQRLVAVGDRGMIVFEDSAPARDQKLRFYDHTITWQDGMPRATKGEANGVAMPFGDANPLRSECQHFLDVIAGKARLKTDSAEGLRVLDVLEQASLCLGGGRRRAPATAADRYPGVTVHESAYVDDGVSIAKGTKIWHFSHVLGEVTIGENCNIGQNVVIGPRVSVGNGVKIQNNVSVYEGVVLEDDVFCGPSCVFTNVNNPRSNVVRKAEYRKTVVRRGASIGANATVVCGHELGEYCFIAAGAVVASDVPAFALMAGVPARRIGWMSHKGMKLGDDLVCPETGQRYRLAGPDRLEEIR